MFRSVQISAVLNGWIVVVGCQTVVYTDRGELTRDLDQYLRDPAGTEERFLKTAINASVTGAGLNPNPSTMNVASSSPREVYAEQATDQYTIAKTPIDRIRR